MKTNYRWSVGALGAIHEAAEHYLITLLENANLCAIHAKRVTISVSNVQLVIKMLDMKKNFKTDESVTKVEDWRRRARDKREENLQQQIEYEEEQVAAARANHAQKIRNKKEKKLEEQRIKRKNRVESDDDSTDEDKSKWRKKDENEKEQEKERLKREVEKK